MVRWKSSRDVACRADVCFSTSFVIVELKIETASLKASWTGSRNLPLDAQNQLSSFADSTRDTENALIVFLGLIPLSLRPHFVISSRQKKCLEERALLADVRETTCRGHVQGQRRKTYLQKFPASHRCSRSNGKGTLPP